ncbi:MAG: WYL domain-containing protein [Alphaproteobacteria bacterium]|nr:WYL domain-containing protein [Alphaproteobacteria bacterium]
MAYTKLRDMLDVALELQASSLGLTIDQLMDRTGRSRKTVERMLQGLSEIGLEMEPSRLESDHHLTKRWRLRADMPGTLLALQSHERGALERHLQTLPEGATTRALAKLLGNQKPLSNHLAIDAEELINRTAHIGRTGPRTQADEAQMAVFERAIQGFEKLELRYRAQGRRRASWRSVDPLGLLFGRFGYLVAARGDITVTYRLDLIEDVRPTGTIFEAPGDWNMKDWAADSFGIYHGDDILDIRLRFTGEAAKRAEKVRFHPGQKMRRIRGALLVELNCQGHRELIHELCHPDWLGQVQIETPDSLRVEFNDYLRQLGSVTA